MFPGDRPELIGAALVLALAAPGAWFLLLSLSRLLRGRFLAAFFEFGAGAALLGSAAIAGLLGLNILTYQRVSAEQSAAEIGFARSAPGRFRATLQRSGSPDRIMDLDGDEWQLDARILKWKGTATLLGLDARYRLERLSGRYRDLDQERSGRHSVYSLAPRSLHGTELVEDTLRRLPWVDAYYGNSAYLPMADGALFRISVSQTGLVARPANAEAEAAVRSWR